MMHKCWCSVVEMTMMKLMDYTRNAMDSKLQRTWPVVEPAGPKPTSDQREGNGFRSETLAAEYAEVREMKSVVLWWKQTDILQLNGGVRDGIGCLLVRLISQSESVDWSSLNRGYY
jgi:hypothetical protein